MVRRRGQRLVVSGYGARIVAELGQGVAKVVEFPWRSLGVGPAFGGALVVLVAVLGGVSPSWVGEEVGGGFRAPLLQRLVALLVRALPEVRPQAGRRRRRQQAGRQSNAHAKGRAGEKALAEAEQQQGQERQCAPVAEVRPGVEEPVRLDALRGFQPRGRQQVGDVRVAHFDAAIAAAAKPGDRRQAVRVQGRPNQPALAVGQMPAGLLHPVQGYGRRGGGADAENGQREARPATGGQLADRIHSVGHQQQAAPLQAGVVQQLMGEVQGAAGVAAQHRHHGRAQGQQEVLYGAHVIRQRRDHVAVPGVGHQPREALLAAAQHVGDLVRRPRQPGGGEVLGEHRQGQIEQDDQGVLLLLHRLRQALPGRPGQAGRAGQEGGRQGPGRPAALRRTRRRQQRLQQLRRQGAAPRRTPPVPARPKQGQEQGRQGA